MMKYGSQKVNFANSDRTEVSDPQFLTFRNNNNAQSNTGRTVFSHKLEMYRSLEKGKQDSDEEEQLAPVRNFKKNSNSNLRLLKSQEKFPSRHYTPIKNLRQQQQKYPIINNNTTKPFPTTSIPTNQHPPTNQLTSSAQYEFKNQLLKKKILKLAKSIKNQQRRQLSLQKDIQQLQHQIQDDDRQIYSQYNEIQQLQTINRQNEVYLNKLAQNYQQFQRKNYHLQSLVEKIEESLENLVNSGKQEDVRVKMAGKLKEGLGRLEALKLQVNNRCIRIQSEIVKLKEFVQQWGSIDGNIRDVTYKRESQDISQFSC